MGIKLYKEPELKNPSMLCGWPGIGNVGIIAIDTLRRLLKAQRLGQIEPWDFFKPRKVIIERGLLKDLEFPSSRFYLQRIKNHDLIFFIGQQQPTEGTTRYAEGQKAYQMASLVLDVAEKFGCRRVYTSGAAVTQIHHTVRPRVWAVPNRPNLIDEVRAYENTKRGLEAICLMGEIPYYLQAAPWPYPKASKSVLEVLTRILGVKIDLSQLDELADAVEKSVEKFLETLYTTEGIPAQVRDEIEGLRYIRQTELGPITDEEQKKIMEHIDELFKGEDWNDERHL